MYLDRGRYEVLRLLGDGMFGRVLECRNTQTDGIVAIKVIRDVARYVENAEIESEILRKVVVHDPLNKYHCVRLTATFFHGRYYSMVCDPLGVSLYDFLKANNYQGFFVEDIQTITKNSLECLEFLHNTMRLTHTDLKLENLLFTYDGSSTVRNPRAQKMNMQRPNNADIKVIDFGNATFEDDHHSSIINTRQYRSPEVILGCGWNEKSDVWSLGCIVMELYLGELLFTTHENLEHLALIEKIIGRVPQDMVSSANEEGRRYIKCRDDEYMINWPKGASSQKSQQRVDEARPLKEQVDSRHTLLADFCEQLLCINPADRITAEEALKHPFLTNILEE